MFCGKTSRGFDLEDLLRASAEALEREHLELHIMQC